MMVAKKAHTTNNTDRIPSVRRMARLLQVSPSGYYE